MERVHDIWCVLKKEMERLVMYSDQMDIQYLEGVNKFCKVLVDNLKPRDKGYIRCPCIDCKNDFKYQGVDKIKEHLIRSGFTEDYEAIKTLHGQHSVQVFECADNVIVELKYPVIKNSD